MAESRVLQSGLTLAAIAIVCTALVAVTWLLTAERIEANRKAFLERSLTPALANLFFDSGVSESRLTLPPPHGLPGTGPALIYRVYAGDAPVAALFVVSAHDGYSGPIRLLIGVTTEYEITGVRVLEHRETPGLGDRIETTKSDWVYQFDGHSLRAPPLARWKIRADGGDFEQLSGASVTPRAVVKAIRETLLWFESNAEVVFSSAADDDGTEPR